MNNKALIITNIIILSGIIIALLVFMIWGITTNHNFFNVENDKLYSETYNLDEITKIKTDLKSYDIEFKENNAENIKIEIFGNKKDKDRVKLNVNNHELNLEERGTSFCFGFCFRSNLIVIYVPKEYQGELNLITVSGNIDILIDINNNVNLKTTSGDIKTKNLINAKIYTTSGDINILKSDNIEANTVSGSIEIKEGKNIKAKSTSGDININHATKFIDIKSTSGDIELDNFTIGKNSKIESVSGEVTINLLNEAFVDAETRSGDKNIKTMRNGKFNLFIKTISGDITVD